MNQPSRKEKFQFFNNLVGVVKGLEGQYTTVDLRNEGCITGKITHVDGFMNVELEDAVFYDPRGFEHPFETFFINSRLIRYVHIPKNQPAVEIIKKQVNNMIIPRAPKVENFKIRRAKRYHQEIVRSITDKAQTSEGQSGTFNC